MGGRPNDDDPERTPRAPPVEEGVPISERVTTVPPPPSHDPPDLGVTREIHAFELPPDAVNDGETTEVPHLASLPVNITTAPETSVSSRPTVRPAEAQAAESSDPLEDPFAEDYDEKA